MKTDNFTANR